VFKGRGITGGGGKKTPKPMTLIPPRGGGGPHGGQAAALNLRKPANKDAPESVRILKRAVEKAGGGVKHRVTKRTRGTERGRGTHWEVGRPKGAKACRAKMRDDTGLSTKEWDSKAQFRH